MKLCQYNEIVSVYCLYKIYLCYFFVNVMDLLSHLINTSMKCTFVKGNRFELYFFLVNRICHCF